MCFTPMCESPVGKCRKLYMGEQRYYVVIHGENKFQLQNNDAILVIETSQFILKNLAF